MSKHQPPNPPVDNAFHLIAEDLRSLLPEMDLAASRAGESLLGVERYGAAAYEQLRTLSTQLAENARLAGVTGTPAAWDSISGQLAENARLAGVLGTPAAWDSISGQLAENARLAGVLGTPAAWDSISGQLAENARLAGVLGTSTAWDSIIDSLQSQRDIFHAVRLSEAAQQALDVSRAGSVSGLDLASLSSAVEASLHLTEATRASLKRWESFHWPGDLGIDQRSLDRLRDLTQGYGDILRAVEDAGAIHSSPAVLTTYPPVSIYRHASALDALTSPEQDEPEEEDATVLGALDPRATLDRYLDEHPARRAMWDGASAALASRNPDRARHFLVSTRELLKRLFDELAPDRDVDAWINASPDRRQHNKTHSKLSYITRGIDVDPFRKFLRQDLQAMLELWKLMNEAVHTTSAHLDDRMLRIIQGRLTSVMVGLLQSAATSDDAAD